MKILLMLFICIQLSAQSVTRPEYVFISFRNFTNKTLTLEYYKYTFDSRYGTNIKKSQKKRIICPPNDEVLRFTTISGHKRFFCCIILDGERRIKPTDQELQYGQDPFDEYYFDWNFKYKKRNKQTNEWSDWLYAEENIIYIDYENGYRVFILHDE
jgi:hypothetical protein